MNAIDTTNTYPQPPAELIDDIRKRLADVPQEILERAHQALMRQPIQEVASMLWKAGVCLGSQELYEYRKTLFRPNALVDPHTDGAPVLREVGADALPSAARGDARPPESPTDHGLRQRLVQLLAARAQILGSTGHGQGTSDHAPAIPAPPCGGALLSDLRAVINRYVVLPEMAAEALALWIVHTYAFTLRQVTTYIGVVSPEKRCGKTTLLELLGLLANRSLTAANISPSALFRVIEETKPTLLIDEADTFLQGRDELAGILNAGYRKGNAYVVRVAEDKGRNTKRRGERPAGAPGEWSTDTDGTQLVKYSCWCPKVMAAIGRLPDTLADRCIIIAMQRKMPGEKCERLRQLDATGYRQRCADFVRAHSDAIGKAQPEIPSALNDRAADIWEPLIAIADLAGGEWPELAREAARQLSASDDEMTLLGYFLKDLRNYMVVGKMDRILSRDIVAAFNPVHHRPWEDLRRGREINEWWLGHKMRELGIRSRSTRVGEANGKGYLLEEVEAAFRRYVPDPELNGVQLGTH